MTEDFARLSRRDVATLLRVSVPTVCNYERRGELSGARVDGKVYYSAEEVELFRRTTWTARRKTTPRPGIIDPFAARIALLVKQGKSMLDIMIATKADPVYVRRIWTEIHVPLEQTPALLARHQAEQFDEEHRQLDAFDRRVELERLRRRRGP